MPDITPIWALPLIATNQAQKDVTHNEAVTALEVLAQLAVESRSIATPPASPVDGQSWIVAVSAADAWAGHEGDIAVWSGGGWRFFTPRDGASAWVKDENLVARTISGTWTTGNAVADASGGTTIDAEARTALNALLGQLRAQGIIAS